ncbi:MAG: hypothetical protein H0W00_02440 [Chloroflexi bacterium]|nr:hypothetical protein [Chloroflexota bacterium]MDQ3449098.1 hypothetical protein [Chloroflexota bacterium]
MAVYQGTRPRAVVPGARPLTGVVPKARRVAPLERRARRGVSRAQRSTSPITFVLVAVVSAFLIGLVYLTQILQVGALDVEVDRLLTQQDQMRREIQSQQGTIARWGAAPQVIDWAHQNGLDPLGGKIRVTRP